MKKAVKKIFFGLGADLCGTAAAEAFAGAPAGFRPADIFPACRSAIVFARRLPAGLAAMPAGAVYTRANDICTHETDRTAFLAALAIERLGARAVPLPADSPYDHWEPERLAGRGLLSLRHAAVLAGLGQLGKNTLLLSPRFGNMLTLGAVLTDLVLEPDPPSPAVCIAGCRRCLVACPAGALDGRTADQSRCRPGTYTENARGFSIVSCNRCRTVCPQACGTC